MSLSAAIELALKLKTALTNQVTAAREARSILKAMKPDALLGYASGRQAFNVDAAHLTADMARAVEQFAHSHGKQDLSMEELRALDPFLGEQLGGVLREVRALSTALAELDAFNQSLAERAMTFVKAYVANVAPPPNAYTRKGTSTERETSTMSERA